MTTAWTTTFFVPGIPQAKGNHRARVVGSKHAQLYDANPKLPAWERAVRYAAMPVRPPSLLTGPVQLELVFWVPRGKTVKRTWPTSARGGDCDKLVRAVGDALKGVIYEDDSQVVIIEAMKRYETLTLGPGCTVTVSEVAW